MDRNQPVQTWKMFKTLSCEVWIQYENKNIGKVVHSISYYHNIIMICSVSVILTVDSLSSLLVLI